MLNAGNIRGSLTHQIAGSLFIIKGVGLPLKCPIHIRTHFVHHILPNILNKKSPE